MVKYLQNPADHFAEDAIVRFTHDDDAIFRSKFNFSTATTAPVITKATSAFQLSPWSLKTPFLSPNKASDESLVFPTGPAPDDGTIPTDMRMPNRGAFSVGHYAPSYSRYLVLETDYTFTIFNYEEFPLVVGYEILPLQIVHSADATLDKTVMTEYGHEPELGLNTLRLMEIAARDNVRLGMIPAGQGSVRMSATAAQGASADANSLHVTPGIGTVSFKVKNRDILEAMAKVRQGTYDVDQYIGSYADPPGEPAFAIAEQPYAVRVFMCPRNAHYEDFQGTAADTDDHFTGLHYEGWGTAAQDWTAKVAIKPSCVQKVRLLDPTIPERPTTTDPDSVQVG